MFGSKFRSWMENHIGRPRKKANKNKAANGNVVATSINGNAGTAAAGIGSGGSSFETHKKYAASGFTIYHNGTQASSAATTAASATPSASSNAAVSSNASNIGSSSAVNSQNSGTIGCPGVGAMNSSGCNVTASPGRRREVSPIQSHTQSRYGWQSPDSETITSPKSDHFLYAPQHHRVRAMHHGLSQSHQYHSQHSAPKVAAVRQMNQHAQPQPDCSSSSISSLSWSTGSKEQSSLSNQHQMQQQQKGGMVPVIAFESTPEQDESSHRDFENASEDAEAVHYEEIETILRHPENMINNNFMAREERPKSEQLGGLGPSGAGVQRYSYQDHKELQDDASARYGRLLPSRMLPCPGSAAGQPYALNCCHSSSAGGSSDSLNANHHHHANHQQHFSMRIGSAESLQPCSSATTSQHSHGFGGNGCTNSYTAGTGFQMANTHFVQRNHRLWGSSRCYGLQPSQQPNQQQQPSKNQPQSTNGATLPPHSLSSPESAYSTGYSTDGTSPGAGYNPPPEYYINMRTGTHYFPKSVNSLAIEAHRYKFGLNKIEEMSPIDPLPKTSFGCASNQYAMPSFYDTYQNQFLHLHTNGVSGNNNDNSEKSTTAALDYQRPTNDNFINVGSHSPVSMRHPIVLPTLRGFESPSPRQRSRIRTNPWLLAIDASSTLHATPADSAKKPHEPQQQQQIQLMQTSTTTATSTISSTASSTATRDEQHGGLTQTQLQKNVGANVSTTSSRSSANETQLMTGTKGAAAAIKDAGYDASEQQPRSTKHNEQTADDAKSFVAGQKKLKQQQKHLHKQNLTNAVGANSIDNKKNGNHVDGASTLVVPEVTRISASESSLTSTPVSQQHHLEKSRLYQQQEHYSPSALRRVGARHVASSIQVPMQAFLIDSNRNMQANEVGGTENYNNNINNNINSQYLSSAQAAHLSDDDATLNEMMGKFDESYIYEKETDILSDSDATNCPTDFDTGLDAGDECDTDELLDIDFIDTPSIHEITDRKDLSQWNMGNNGNYYCSISPPVRLARQHSRRSSRNSAASQQQDVNNGNAVQPSSPSGTPAMGRREGGSRRRKRLVKTRKKSTDNQHAGGHPAEKPQATHIYQPRYLRQPCSPVRRIARETRSVGGSPISLRRHSNNMTYDQTRAFKTSPLSNRATSLIFTHVRERRFLTVGDSEKALLKADMEADVKYRQLIQEAESILVSLKSSLQSIPRETPVASPRRLNPLANKRVEMLKNCESDIGKRESHKQQQQQRIQEIEVDAAAAVNRRIELIKSETPVSAPNSPRSTARFSPRKTHLTNFMQQQNASLALSNAPSTPKSPQLQLNGRYLLQQNAKQQQQGSPSSSPLSQRYRTRCGRSQSPKTARQANAHGKCNDDSDTDVDTDCTLSKHYSSNESLRGNRPRQGNQDVLNHNYLPEIARILVCEGVSSGALAVCEDHKAQQSYCPQSEPLKRKVYKGSSSFERLKHSFDLDSELPKKVLLDKINNLRLERQRLHNKTQQEATSQWQEQQQQHDDVSYQEDEASIASNMSSKKHLILSTLADLKQSLENQSFELSGLNNGE